MKREAVWQPVTAAIVLALAALFPVVITNGLATTIGVETMIFVAAAAAWNIFSGFSGYISLGHAVFFGTGAYTVAILAQHWHMTGESVFWLMPLGAVAGAIVAIPFGLVALQARRHTFVVITIAIFFIFQLMAFNFGFTGGSSGIIAPILNWDAATYNNPFYYIALIIGAFTVGLGWLIRGSRFGLQLRAIRDDEDRARGLGVKTLRVKLSALVISAFITGMIGGLFYYFIGQAVPQFIFDPLFDLAVALMAFFGGLGTVAGPVLGAIIIEPAQQYLTVQLNNDYLSEILLGALFLAVILLVPRGIIPTTGERISKWRSRQAGRPRRPPRPRGAGRAAARGRPGQGGRQMSERRGAAPPGLRSEKRRRSAGATREGGVTRRPAGERRATHEHRAAAHRARGQVIRRRAGAHRRHAGSARGQHHRADRPERIRQDHPVQRHDGLRAAGLGPGLPRRREDHQRLAAEGVRPRHRPDLPAQPDLPAAHRHGEHAGRPRQHRRGVRNPLARAGGPPTGGMPWSCWSSPGSPGTPARWPRPCPTASASCSSWPTCWSPTRTWCCSTSRPAGSTPR